MGATCSFGIEPTAVSANVLCMYSVFSNLSYSFAVSRFLGCGLHAAASGGHVYRNSCGSLDASSECHTLEVMAIAVCQIAGQ